MKTLSEMSFDEKLAWACGTILIGIGEGKFRSAVSGVIQYVNSEAFDRGKNAGIEIERERQRERLKLKLKRRREKA